MYREHKSKQHGQFPVEFYSYRSSIKSQRSRWTSSYLNHSILEYRRVRWLMKERNFAGCSRTQCDLKIEAATIFAAKPTGLVWFGAEESNGFVYLHRDSSLASSQLQCEYTRTRKLFAWAFDMKGYLFALYLECKINRIHVFLFVCRLRF